MSTALQPVITKAGLAAVFNATRTGLAAEITHVVLGDRAYTPSADQIVLGRQLAKYPIVGGEKLSSTLLHLTAVADGESAFYVREIGFLLSDGTLFAVWSSTTEVLAYKAAGIDLLLAYDLSLAALPANSVTINSIGAGLSLSLAAPFAALAAAQVAAQFRDLKQQDLLDSQTDQQRITASTAPAHQSIRPPIGPERIVRCTFGSMLMLAPLKSRNCSIEPPSACRSR